MVDQIIPPLVPLSPSQSDHDLLTTLNANVTNLSNTVTSYMANKSAKDDEVDKRQRDHQARLDKLEGAVSLLKWLIGLVVVLAAAGITYVGTR